MSETTKTPRVHAEMAARFMADDSLKCWTWVPCEKRWLESQTPVWHAHLTYHVGHEVPTEPPKRKVTMAGITFNAPETKAPSANTRYWIPYPLSETKVYECSWTCSPIGSAFDDLECLRNGLVHLKEEDARLHAEALIKLSKELR